MTTQALWQRPIPTNILDAEQALREFDSATLWGPKCSVTRSERLARGRKYFSSAGWEWVDAILQRFPALGSLKAHKKLQVHECSSEAIPPTLDANARLAQVEQHTQAPGVPFLDSAQTAPVPVRLPRHASVSHVQPRPTGQRGEHAEQICK